MNLNLSSVCGLVNMILGAIYDFVRFVVVSSLRQGVDARKKGNFPDVIKLAATYDESSFQTPPHSKYTLSSHRAFLCLVTFYTVFHFIFVFLPFLTSIVVPCLVPFEFNYKGNLKIHIRCLVKTYESRRQLFGGYYSWICRECVVENTFINQSTINLSTKTLNRMKLNK